MSPKKCLFLNTYYPKFLAEFYRENIHLISKSYQEQKAVLQAQCFGDSDFYSHGLRQAGWEADELIVNDNNLQQAWARQVGFGSYQKVTDIALEQIRRFKPDVLYFQDLSLATGSFIAAVRPLTSLIVGQIASPIPAGIDLRSFDILISSFPHYVEEFRRLGITAYYQPLAFDERILERVSSSHRKHLLTFVGGLSAAHSERTEFLEKIAQQLPIDFWGYGVELLPQESALRKNYHGEAWGIRMFEILAQSYITLNFHINVAGNYANNMRLYEASGCGALLITDYKDNLNELFTIGKEVVAYRSVDEAISLVKYYLRYVREGEVIAQAGQQRTLREHTYTKRMEQTAEILERHLRYQHEKQYFGPVDLSKISYGHTPIAKTAITPQMTTAWQSELIPARQRALVRQELEQMLHGNPPVVYRVLAELLRPYVTNSMSILEIGCSSGYYYEVLSYLLNKRLNYHGVDYSTALIKMAKDYYPQEAFTVADGSRLPYQNGAFPLVISGGILLHVPNYPDHIADTVRVASRYVAVHRTPICRRRETQYIKKFAYGVETVELRFNEQELLGEFYKHALKLISAITYYSDEDKDEYEASYLFSR